MTHDREQIITAAKDWWIDFQETHEDWRYADREAIIYGAFAAGAASRDAEIARLKTVPVRYRRMAFNAQLQDEVARLEQENDQLRAQIKQKDAEIADLLEANRIACEDLVEQQNLRVKYAGQIAELVAALERIGKYPRVSGDELGYEGCRIVAREALAKVRKQT